MGFIWSAMSDVKKYNLWYEGSLIAIIVSTNIPFERFFLRLFLESAVYLVTF